MIENVIHGNRRTVEFSLPIGTNEETSPRNITTRMKMRVDSTERTSFWNMRARAVYGGAKKLRLKTARMITKGYGAGNSIV